MAALIADLQPSCSSSSSRLLALPSPLLQVFGFASACSSAFPASGFFCSSSKVQRQSAGRGSRTQASFETFLLEGECDWSDVDLDGELGSSVATLQEKEKNSISRVKLICCLVPAAHRSPVSQSVSQSDRQLDGVGGGGGSDITLRMKVILLSHYARQHTQTRQSAAVTLCQIVKPEFGSARTLRVVSSMLELSSMQ